MNINSSFVVARLQGCPSNTLLLLFILPKSSDAKAWSGFPTLSKLLLTSTCLLDGVGWGKMAVVTSLGTSWRSSLRDGLRQPLVYKILVVDLALGFDSTLPTERRTRILARSSLSQLAVTLTELPTLLPYLLSFHLKWAVDQDATSCEADIWTWLVGARLRNLVLLWLFSIFKNLIFIMYACIVLAIE